MMELEDDSDRVYYSQIDNSLSSGDYATSMKMKPKFTLSLMIRKQNGHTILKVTIWQMIS